MEKQFKFFVAIEQYDQETIEFCKELGYEIENIKATKYLINNSYGVNGMTCVCNVLDSKRILCNWKTEKELCKALLAATEGTTCYKYEIYIEDDGEYRRGIRNVFHLGDCRKPTLEQLLTRFRKPMEKKIIGFQFKNEPFRKSFAQLMGFTDTYEGKFTTNSHVYKSLVSLQVLDLWCEPIYEEDKLFLDDEKTIEVKIIDGGLIEIKDTSFRLNELNELYSWDKIKGVDIYIYGKKLTFEKLEEIKEMLSK
jgi:hypothetical protein